MSKRQFTVVSDEGPFLIGKLEDPEQLGAFLSVGYLEALRQLLVELQHAEASPARATAVPDALGRLDTVLQALFRAQRAAAPQPAIDVDLAQRQLAALLAQFNGGDDGPRRA